MGAEQVRKRILECPGVGPGGSFNASFSYKKLFPLAHRWLDEEIKRKGKGTSTLGERSTTERKLYAAFGKDESLLKKNLLILFQLVDWIVSQVRGFTSRARSLVQVQNSPNGDIAQLVERCLCTADVSGSSPLISTILISSPK